MSQNLDIAQPCRYCFRSKRDLYAHYELRKAIKIQFDKVVRELNAVETKSESTACGVPQKQIFQRANFENRAQWQLQGSLPES